jgi:hypothetical protein
MKFNKWTIGLAAVALLALFTPTKSDAQVPTYGSDTITLPLVQANMTTNLLLNTNQVFIDFSKQQNCGMQFNCSWSVTGTASGETNAVYKLAPTYDGSTFSTNNVSTVTVIDQQTAVGAVQRWSTNMVANGQKGWIVYQIQNTHATGILTNNITRGTKISSP